jgi:hypothetical protein
MRQVLPGRPDDHHLGRDDDHRDVDHDDYAVATDRHRG